MIYPFIKKSLFAGLVAAMILLCSCSTEEKADIAAEEPAKQPLPIQTMSERIEKSAEYQGIEPHILPAPEYPKGFVRGHLPDCPKAEMVELPTQYYGWHTTAFLPCCHHDPFAKDVEQQQILDKVRECKNCGYTETESFIETRIAHIS